MRKRTITKAVLLTATILALTGCNSSTGANTTTVPETSSAIEQVTEETTTTSSEQETETSSTSTEQGEETTTATATIGSDEPTIPETTVEIEATTQVAGYDGICSEYGHAEVEVDTRDVLFQDVSPKTACWMSHTDYISTCF